MSRMTLLLIVAALLPYPANAQQARLLVSTQWVEDNLHRSDLVVLHASRDGADYHAGHIPGARLIRLDQVSWDGDTGVGVELRRFVDIRDALAEAGVSDESTIVVYGSSPMVAARVWMTVDVAGAGTREPLFMDGGLQLWQEEGRALSSEVPSPSRGTLRLRPDENRLVTAEWILVRLGHDGLSLVDARPYDEYWGEDGGLGGRVNPGHIPSARQLFWEELVESRDRPVFLPAREMEALFIEAGADPGDMVVTYCQVGLRASVTYMIARMMGYETRFFEGSWRDWGSRDFPHFPRRASQG